MQRRIATVIRFRGIRNKLMMVDLKEERIIINLPW